MNPEGKMHDYSDLPEEEVPDMSQMVMVGNPEIAKTLANNMNECKGRGKRNPVAIQSAKNPVAIPAKKPVAVKKVKPITEPTIGVQGARVCKTPEKSGGTWPDPNFSRSASSKPDNPDMGQTRPEPNPVQNNMLNTSYKGVAAPSFAGSFRQVFDSRRGMFEQSVSSGNRPDNNTPNNTPITQHKCQKLVRSKTLPDLPKMGSDHNIQKNIFDTSEEKDQMSMGSASLKRPLYQIGTTSYQYPPSPLVPKRTSSKQMVAKMSTNEIDGNNTIRRPLRNFFYNA